MVIFYRFSLYNKDKNNKYGLSMYDKSFFSAFCWYKDKVFSEKDSFYSLHADSFDIVIIGVYSHDTDKFVPLIFPFFVCHLEELRCKEITPDESDALKNSEQTNLFIATFCSFMYLLIFPPKIDYDLHMID